LGAEKVASETKVTNGKPTYGSGSTGLE
jgi:hypothetical protein